MLQKKYFQKCSCFLKSRVAYGKWITPYNIYTRLCTPGSASVLCATAVPMYSISFFTAYSERIYIQMINACVYYYYLPIFSRREILQVAEYNNINAVSTRQANLNNIIYFVINNNIHFAINNNNRLYNNNW